LDFVHFPAFWRTQRFGNLICFRPQVNGWETPALLGPLETGNLDHWTAYASLTTAIYTPEIICQREITGTYTVKIMILHVQTWSQVHPFQASKLRSSVI
jgi:hypothetical protein